MATSSRRTRRWVTPVVAAGLLAAIIAPLTLAHSSAGSRVADGGARAARSTGAGGFSWLESAPPPPGWRTVTIASGGATLRYPPSWRPIPGDKGTVTAALRDANAKFTRRFHYVEDRAKQDGVEMKDAGLERLDGYWNEIRAADKAGA